MRVKRSVRKGPQRGGASQGTGAAAAFRRSRFVEARQLRRIGGNRSGLLESHGMVTLNVGLHVVATVT
jgi:hypothetical protein